MNPPADVLEKIKAVLPILEPRPFGAAIPLWPMWFPQGSGGWLWLLQEAHDEIAMQRKQIADFKVMQEGYSRLYKIVYGDAR